MRDVGWSGRSAFFGSGLSECYSLNINGYKTDGVIDETISHRAEIRDDGSIVDNVTVKRMHTGGIREGMVG